jgi:hypothetical protein
MKNRFQAFAFKRNLYRYALEAFTIQQAIRLGGKDDRVDQAGGGVRTFA